RPFIDVPRPGPKRGDNCHAGASRATAGEHILAVAIGLRRGDSAVGEVRVVVQVDRPARDDTGVDLDAVAVSVVKLDAADAKRLRLVDGDVHGGRGGATVAVADRVGERIGPVEVERRRVADV